MTAMSAGMVDRITAARFLPRIVPAPWRVVSEGDDGAMYVMPNRHASVIVSVAREQDGRLWLHASMGRPDRLPTWDELAAMKAWAIGTDRYAYQVIPPASKHVNIHPNVLHLWAPLEGDLPLPDFTHGGDTI